MKIPVAVVRVSALAGLSLGRPAQAQDANVVYHGGTIVTVDDDHPTAEAVAIRDGKILVVGSRGGFQGNRRHSGAGWLRIGKRWIESDWWSILGMTTLNFQNFDTPHETTLMPFRPNFQLYWFTNRVISSR